MVSAEAQLLREQARARHRQQAQRHKRLVAARLGHLQCQSLRLRAPARHTATSVSLLQSPATCVTCRARSLAAWPCQTISMAVQSCSQLVQEMTHQADDMPPAQIL